MTALLGGLSPKVFLRDYWQKRPLFVKQALPNFSGLIGRDDFLHLATRGDVRSRLLIHHAGKKARWERHDGPFGELNVDLLPARAWTLLINGLESLIPGGWELLSHFDFIPKARVDDLMVSYAADGGSVGPHDDQYDVFLIQGPGLRRWQIARHYDPTPDPKAAVNVLREFVAEEEWECEPGDLLYLPPRVAHWGVALGPCFTYSVGFLAPSHADLLQNFLGYLGEALAADVDHERLYEDPDLRLERDPFAINDAMLRRVNQVLTAVREAKWGDAAVADFLGRYLTRPKPGVRFHPPARPIDLDAFARRLRDKRGRLVLALPTRGLVRRNRVFLNGEGYTLSPAETLVFQALVRERGLALPVRLGPHLLELMHEWYGAGYLHFGPRGG